jgi:hypothetical protein
MTKKDELAALRKRIEELEAKAKPPEPKPFTPEPYQRYDPTAGMSMPRSTMMEMARAVPDHVLRDIAMRDNRAPTGRPGMIPDNQQPTSPRPSVGDGTGWQAPTPISSPPGVALCDKLMDHADAVDRAALIEREARFKAMEKMTEQTEKLRQQTEALAKRMEQKHG